MTHKKFKKSFLCFKESLFFIYLKGDVPSTVQSEVESTSDLGAVDSASIAEEISSTTNKRKPKYEKWNPKARHSIGKYASENGNAAAIRKFKPDYPNLSESTVRTFKTKYQEELKKAEKEKRDPSKTIEKYSSKTGRPLMLGELDSMVQTYLTAQSRKGCVINRCIANATARALMNRYPNLIGNIDLEESSWARSMFRRMGLVRRRKTSSKIEIPEAARKEISLIEAP